MAVPKIKFAIGNSASTTLSSGITNTDTSAPLTATTNFQAKSGEGMVIIDEGASGEELAYATALSGSALTIPLANRGLEGGSAQAHSASASVKGILSASMVNDMADSMLNILDQTSGDIDHAELTGALYAADAGSNDTYAITLSPAPASYTAITGLPITFKANTANTGAATLNVNSLGAKTIKKRHDVDLADNDIESGQVVTVVYDGTNFEMQSQIANTTTAVTSIVDEDDAGSSSTSSSTFADITGADVSITLTATSHIVLMATVSAYQNSGSTVPYGIQWHDGTNLIGVEIRSELITGNARTCTTIQTIAQSQAAGTYTYTVRHRSQNNSASITAEAINLIAFSIPA